MNRGMSNALGVFISVVIRSRFHRFYLGYIVLILSFVILILFSRIRQEHLHCSNIIDNDKSKEGKDFHYSIGSQELSMIAAHIFPREKQYYYNYTSYDFYSVREIERTRPSQYWQKFSLDSLKQYSEAKSQFDLAFVDSIMVVTGKHLKVRHEHLQKVLIRQGIPVANIEYRWSWNKEKCSDLRNVAYIKSRYPYISGNHSKDVACANVMEHIDVWHSIAERKSFALILEDDVAFVPFAKEKFNRFMAEAVKLKLFKVRGNRNECPSLKKSDNTTIADLLKNPTLPEGIFHFGKCLNIPTPGLNPETLLDVPKISSYRSYHFGRCAHMYGMTHCAAKMMINGLHKYPMRYQWSDWLINHLITNSVNLVGWWTDPPLGYQTSQIEVISELHELLKQRTYDPSQKEPVP